VARSEGLTQLYAYTAAAPTRTGAAGTTVTNASARTITGAGADQSDSAAGTRRA
jgi:hypothetical protein